MRFLHKKSEVLQCWTCAPLGCACDNILEEVLAKFLPPLVHFHCWKKMLQIILSLIGLSVCLISLCSSLIGLCAYLISLSQNKPISTGLFWEKLVEKCKVAPDYDHFFHKLTINFSNHWSISFFITPHPRSPFLQKSKIVCLQQTNNNGQSRDKYIHRLKKIGRDNIGVWCFMLPNWRML